ncbi:L-ornithine-N5-monooxygenase [Mariannaea sp. PMI_226]|nr:L-ornithine-N5-monooxygenase [Mariannaea sp. PMI_226]
MHQRYGDFVRIGPNEISILNADAYEKVHGYRTKCSKKDTGVFDSLTYKGEHRLVSITDHTQHRKRRKIWDQSLNKKALEVYELATRRVMRDWLYLLNELNGASIDISKYVKLVAVDNMGHVGYSVDFGTLRDGHENRMTHLLDITFRNFAKIGQMAWPQALIMDLPRFGMQKEFEDIGVRMVDQRVQNDSDDKNDMMKYFLADIRSKQPQALMNMNAVYSDSQSIMAGSTHTTTAVLHVVFYYLARDSRLRQRIYDEITPLYGRTVPGEFTASDLNGALFLDSVITEAMRINGPTPLSSPRSVPSEGIEVDGTHLPGGINVFTPLHVYNRSEKYYKQPNEFIPERWTTRTDLVIEKRVYHPFGFGHYDCVGKRLVKNVLHMVIAYTLWTYDFEFAPGEDGTMFHQNDKFQVALKPGRVECVFIKRG